MLLEDLIQNLADGVTLRKDRIVSSKPLSYLTSVPVSCDNQLLFVCTHFCHILCFKLIQGSDHPYSVCFSVISQLSRNASTPRYFGDNIYALLSFYEILWFRVTFPGINMEIHTTCRVEKKVLPSSALSRILLWVNCSRSVGQRISICFKKCTEVCQNNIMF